MAKNINTAFQVTFKTRSQKSECLIKIHLFSSLAMEDLKCIKSIQIIKANYNIHYIYKHSVLSFYIGIIKIQLLYFSHSFSFCIFVQIIVTQHLQRLNGYACAS